MAIKQQVKSVLEQHLPDALIDVDITRGSRKVSGYIVWDGFEDQEQIERQRYVRKLLSDALGSEVLRVSTILTYTPNEYQRMAAA